MEAKLTPSLTENEQYLAITIGRGADINYRHLVIPVLDNCHALIVNIKGID